MCNILRGICILLIILCGCSGGYNTKEDLLVQGTDLLASGNPGGAIITLKNALERDRNYFDARLALARAYLAARNFESAEKELRKLQKQRPNSREVHILLTRVLGGESGTDETPSDRGDSPGFVLLNNKRPVERERLLKQGVMTAPGNASLRFHLAVASLARNNEPPAVGQARQTICAGGFLKPEQEKNGLTN